MDWFFFIISQSPIKRGRYCNCVGGGGGTPQPKLIPWLLHPILMHVCVRIQLLALPLPSAWAGSGKRGQVQAPRLFCHQIAAVRLGYYGAGEACASSCSRVGQDTLARLLRGLEALTTSSSAEIFLEQRGGSWQAGVRGKQPGACVGVKDLAVRAPRSANYNNIIRTMPSRSLREPPAGGKCQLSLTSFQRLRRKGRKNCCS